MPPTSAPGARSTLRVPRLQYQSCMSTPTAAGSLRHSLRTARGGSGSKVAETRQDWRKLPRGCLLHGLLRPRLCRGRPSHLAPWDTAAGRRPRYPSSPWSVSTQNISYLTASRTYRCSRRRLAATRDPQAEADRAGLAPIHSSCTIAVNAPYTLHIASYRGELCLEHVSCKRCSPLASYSTAMDL